MKQSQKLLIILLLLGLSFIMVIVTSIFKLNSGETPLVRRQAYNFLKLISENKYSEAFQFVDSSQISIEELKKIGNIATHFLPDATYFYHSNKDVYIIGFKTLKDDNDTINDNKLEFFITKIKGEWKVTYISYNHA